MLKLGVLFINEFPPGEWKALAQDAESLGYDYLWQADERFFREVYGGLTFAAVNTRRIRLGPCVTDPYSRHPAMTAMAMATLDEYSGGRAVLVIGAGKSGFGEMGINREKPALAIKEAIELIRRLWSGETVDFEGRTVHFRDGRLNFPARPDIPIFVASEGPLTLRCAGEVADGVLIGSTASEISLRSALMHVDEGLARAGRTRTDIEIGVRLDVCVADSADAARRPLRSILLRMLLRYYPDLTPFKRIGLAVPPELATFVSTFDYRGYSRDRERVEQAAALIPDELVDPFCLAGTPADVAAQVRRLLSLGLNHLTIYPVAPPGGSAVDTMRRIAREVRPLIEVA